MRFLLRPGWLAFIALVVGFAVACYALLAPWQFGRERQREAQEQAIATADATPPVPLAELVPPGAAVTPELEWRQVTVTGTYLAEAEAVVRLRTLDSKAAVEVLTPMRLDDGRVVAVDRGLAPLTDDGAVPAYPAPPGGTVTVTARLRMDRHDPSDRPVVRGARRAAALRRRLDRARRDSGAGPRRAGSSSSRRTSPACSPRCRSARRWRTPRPSRTSPTPCSGGRSG